MKQIIIAIIHVNLISYTLWIWQIISLRLIVFSQFYPSPMSHSAIGVTSIQTRERLETLLLLTPSKNKSVCNPSSWKCHIMSPYHRGLFRSRYANIDVKQKDSGVNLFRLLSTERLQLVSSHCGAFKLRCIGYCKKHVCSPRMWTPRPLRLAASHLLTFPFALFMFPSLRV